MSEKIQPFLDAAHQHRTDLEGSRQHNFDRGDDSGLDLKPLNERDPNGPQVIFPSPAMDLDLEEEELLVATALRRLREMERESGIDHLGEGALDAMKFVNLRNKWMPMRELCDKMFEGDVDWREKMFGPDSLYAYTNINLPMTRQTVDKVYAKIMGYFFDTDPWFSCEPQREIPEELAELHQFFLKYKADRSRLKQVFSQALLRVCKNGEAILKGTYEIRDKIFWDVQTVAVDAPDGDFLLTMENDYIFEDDEWLALMIDPETGEQTRDPQVGVYVDLDMNPLPTDEETGAVDPGMIIYYLEKDPETTMTSPQKLVFEERRIRQQQVDYDGADLDLVWYQDILIPLQAKSIEDADCVVHLYDETASNLVSKYMDVTDGEAFNDPLFIDFVESVASADGTPKSRAGQRPGDDKTAMEAGDSTIKIGEFYMDFVQDGQVYDVMLVMDLTNERPIYYDYVARITADGKRPFQVLRVNPVENRWYGNSLVGMLWGLQDFLDTCINRMNLSQTESGRIDIVKLDSFYQFDNVKNKAGITLNNRSFLTAKPDVEDVRKAIGSVYLNDIKHDVLMSLMQITQQFAANMLGVVGAADADMAGLPTTQLATGIEHLEMIGQEMTAPMILDLIPGFEASTEMFLKITIANLDRDEDFKYFKDGESQFAKLVVDEIRDVDYNIKLELTTYKGQQQLAQLNMAREAFKEFIQLPYLAQVQAAPLYIETAKVAQIRQADQIFQPIDVTGQAGPRPRQITQEMIDEAIPEDQLRPQANL